MYVVCTKDCLCIIKSATCIFKWLDSFYDDPAGFSMAYYVSFEAAGNVLNCVRRSFDCIADSCIFPDFTNSFRKLKLYTYS
jgi:hypothetical protein